jgi:hypothetical protein
MSALSIHRNGKKLRSRIVWDGARHGDVSEANVRGEVCARDTRALRYATKVFTRDTDVYALYRCEEDCSKDLSQRN